ncbi:MAG: DUF5591 domain-containing protein [Thermoplasmataceae archaeon]
MFIDQGFFGFARTGEIKKRKYPLILDWSKDILRGKNFSILEEEFTHTIEIEVKKRKVKLRMSENFIMLEESDILIQRPKLFVETIMEIHKINGFKRLIYSPLIGDPYLIPVLSLLGISVFDNFISEIEGENKILYTALGRSKTDKDSRKENSEFLNSMAENVAVSIINGTLFDIAEKLLLSSKALEILRILVYDYNGNLEEVFPRRTEKIMSYTNISMKRPDILRFQDYIKNQYLKPRERSIGLFIPCSAKKPYSESKSHKLLIDTIADLRRYVHEVIMTSPMGLVPRELEETYPASFYDIPVTGRWSEEEKEMLLGVTSNYLQRNHYDKIIAFITEDYLFSSAIFPEGTEIITWKKGDMNSLMELRKKLEEIILENPLPFVRDSFREKFLGICEYQFGNWILPYLSKGKIIKNYNQFMIVIEGKPALIYQDRKGKMTINKNFTKPFIENGKFLVEIDDFKPTANIYAVGVISTSEDIRPEDEIVLHHSGDPRGAGTAKMPHSAMINLDKGVAVKVRN